MLFPEHESSTLEFKESIPAKDQILRTVIGFCNLYGGRLIIGVRDNHEIVGVPDEEVNGILEYLHKNIYESCTPPIFPTIYTQRFGVVLALIIRVDAGMNKPYHLRSEGVQRGTYIRMGRSTLRADPQTILDLQNQSRGISADAVPVYNAIPDCIRPELVKKFLSSKPAGFRGTVDPNIMTAYNLIRREQTRSFPTAGGVLLFSENPQRWFPEAFIICTRFKGISGRNAESSRDCTGTLFDQFEASYDFIINSLEKSFFIEGRRRKEQYEIPIIAVREILMNAIVHRNYSITGPTKVAIFDNRIEIFSPGTFPGPLDTENLTAGITYIRNTIVAKVFREAGYIEKLGTGFLTVFDSYDKMGLKKPLVIEGENYIKCVLPREKEHEVFISDEAKILRLFYTADSISVGDIVRQLGIARATAGRRLSELHDAGKLRRSGRGRACRYSAVAQPEKKT
jgi:ATP-dependent DNA helicase RecG